MELSARRIRAATGLEASAACECAEYALTRCITFFRRVEDRNGVCFEARLLALVKLVYMNAHAVEL